MSLNINLYKNFSKRDNSTLQPAAGVSYDTFSCAIKAGCSITSPVIDVDLASGSDPAAAGYNYGYIPAYSRYYFITDWEYIEGIWVASLAVDVLASFKTSIGAETHYIKRSASNFNGYIRDSFYPTKAGAAVECIPGSLDLFDFTTNGCYILGLIGESQTYVPNVGGVNYYMLTPAQLAQFSEYLMGDTLAALMSDSSAGLTTAVAKMIGDPLQYVVSCTYYPFTISASSTYVQPRLGWWNTSPLTSPGCPALGSGGTLDVVTMAKSVGTGTVTLTSHPQIIRGQYLNAEPYSNYEFILEPFGSITIPGDLLMNGGTISYNVTVELLEGYARLILYMGDVVLATKTAQVGVPISMAQLTTGMVKGVSSVAGTVWDRAKSYFNIGEGTISNAIDGILDSAGGYADNVSKQGVNGSTLSYNGFSVNNYDAVGPYLKITRFNLVDEDLAEWGRPYCAMAAINTLSGYVLCGDGETHVEALNSEKDMITSYLLGGFFYE